MSEDFKKYLVSACRCNPDQRFLLAVSGGIDSVVMAHLFYENQLKFSIAHCNFQLRGEESTGDQHFVEEMAERMKVKCHVIKFETSAYAKEHGISVQMAARDLRYKWFHELADQYGYDAIAVGHNKNDVAETFLLNLSRGTGIRGLMGMRSRADRIIRPLLYASRLSIAAYAGDHELEWREDSSNTETKYQRNKIRHLIVPAFESINPSFVQNTLDTIERIEQTGALLDFVIQIVKQEVWTEMSDRVLINIIKLRQYPANELLLFELLRDYGISQIDMSELMASFEHISGRQFRTRTHTLTLDREHLIITGKSVDLIPEILIQADTEILTFPVKLRLTFTENSEEFNIPRKRNMAALDAQKIKFPLLLRGWKTGDRFYPLGLKGSKKISDYLINIKLPIPDKSKVRILESGGDIIWLVNHRIDDRFKVTDKTSKILLVEYQE